MPLISLPPSETAGVARPRPEHMRRLVLGLAAVLALGTFVLEFALALSLNARGDIEMLNRFFDSDSAWYLVNFETGNQSFGSYGGRGPVHPNVANFVHPPVVVVAGLMRFALGGTYAERKRQAALAVAPTAAALRTTFLFLALSTAGFTIPDALLATSLSIVSFSGLLFGAVPESFGLSGALFACAFYLSVRDVNKRRFESIAWLIAGSLICSTTVTNLVPFSFLVLLLLLSLGYDWRAAIGQTARTSGFAIASAFCLFVLLTALHGSFHGIGRRVGQLEEVSPNIRSAFWKMPRALLATLSRRARVNYWTG